jgi:hypothetical protein
MPRSGVNGTYTLPPNTDNQQPNTVIRSAMFNAAMNDVQQTFNTPQPVAFGGTGVVDLKLPDSEFGIRNSTDTSKLATISAANISASTTRTYDLPDANGTVGLVSDIRGQIYGLTLSNNVTDATNDINIAAGSAVDSTGAVSMLLASGYTKRLDAAWAVGTGNGGRMSAAAIADTTYHVFLIRRPDTGVVDVGFDTSPTAPTLPANYTQFRRIGSIIRESGAIVGFLQFGDKFLRTSLFVFTSALNPGTSPFNVTLGVPEGLNFSVLLQVGSVTTNATPDSRGIIYFSGAPSSPGVAQYNFGSTNLSASGAANPQSWNELEVTCATNARVTAKLQTSGAASQLIVNTVGWVDTRGKNS